MVHERPGLIFFSVITQVFPDEFHLHTLDQFLSATSRLNPHVNVKAIVIGMMDRLAAYAARETDAGSPEDKKRTEEDAVTALLEKLRIAKEEKEAKKQNGEVTKGESEAPQRTSTDEYSSSVASESTAVNSEAPTETTEAEPTPPEENNTQEEEGENKAGVIPEKVKLFEIFFEQVASVVKTHRLPIQDIIALLVSLSNLALNIYPDRLDYVDQVFSFANEKVALFANSADLHSQATQSHILGLLLAPIKAYFSLFTALAIPNFIPLLHAQPYPTRRSVAREVAQGILKNYTEISSVENLESLLEILKVLIKEGIQQPSGYTGGLLQRKVVETDETIEEQGWLARIVHLVQSENNDTQFKVIYSITIDLFQY